MSAAAPPRPEPDAIPARARLGVAGWPVGHSRSPAMQNAALHAVGLSEWRYSLLPVPPEVFAETVSALPAVGFRGINVTIPHKAAALSLSSDPSDAARAIGAANTLRFEGNRITAENTDAPGLISALPIAVRGCRALVLGAGGSASATVWALLDAGAREVSIWNRTPERARGLAERFGATAVADREAARVLAAAEMLVNCTTHGLSGDEDSLKGLPFGVDDMAELHCVADFVYRASDTPLVHSAREHGIAVVDGLELLVRQGALSFELFTGCPAPVEVMRAAAHGV